MKQQLKTVDDVRKLMEQRRQDALNRQRGVSEDGPTESTPASILLEKNDLEASHSKSTTEKATPKGKGKKKTQETPTDSAGDHQSPKSTKKGATPSVNGTTPQVNGTADSSFVSSTSGTPLSKNQRRRQRRKQRQLEKENEIAQQENAEDSDVIIEEPEKEPTEQELDVSGDVAENETPSKKKKPRKKKKGKKAKESVENDKPESIESEQPATQSSDEQRLNRKRRAADKIEIIPVEDTNGKAAAANDEEPTDYIVESPDENGEPKRPRIDDDDDDEVDVENENSITDDSDDNILLFGDDGEGEDGGEDISWSDNSEDDDDSYGSFDFDLESGELDNLDGQALFDITGAERNSDDDVDDIISSIRPRDEGESDEDDEDADEDAEEELGDDLAALAEGDDEELYAEDSDATDDSFVVADGDGEEEDEDVDMEDIEGDDDDEGDEDVENPIDGDQVGVEMDDENEVDTDESGEDEEDDDSFGESAFSDITDESIPMDPVPMFKFTPDYKLEIDGYSVNIDGLLIEVTRATAKVTDDGFEVYKFSKNEELHSSMMGMDAFKWLVAPVDTDEFFEHIYQRRVLHVVRRHRAYHKGLFTSDNLLKIVQENDLEYGKHINVAHYTADQGRVTNSTEGRVFAHQLKDFVANGWSIQCMNPQSYSDEIWYLCELLQNVTNSFVGANTYLTPANAAGFAPHWDEIDAFVIQTEGRKYWRVWSPQLDQVLPSESSGNFSESDMQNHHLVFEGFLDEGDVLYIPRGFLHAASAGKTHSLHVTVSFNRVWTFTHLVQTVLDDVIASVDTEIINARRSLPPYYGELNGRAPIDFEVGFNHKITPIILDMADSFKTTLVEQLPTAIDRMATEFIRTALPPMLTPNECKHSVHGAVGLNMFHDASIKVTMSTEVRLIRASIQRLVYEEPDKPMIVHSVSNSRIPSPDPELRYIPISRKDVRIFTTLLDAYPQWLGVRFLEAGKQGRRFAELLYFNGLLLVRKP